jgi:4'-phosphopantetheinyl transferase
MPDSALVARTLQWDALATEAHAWMLWTDTSAPERQWLAWLTPEESEHLRRLKTESLRRQYLATRALCRVTLSRYADVDPARWRFRAGRNGKPRIAGPPGFTSLRFNLTHTKELVICLVTRTGEVGVDAEETSRRVEIDRVSKHFFSKKERASLAKLPPTRRTSRFFELWVLKEAYLKGRGDGLLRDPDQFTVNIGDDLRALPLGEWQLTLHRPGRRHVAAAAVRSEKAVRIKWLDARRLFKASVAVE